MTDSNDIAPKEMSAAKILQRWNSGRTTPTGVILDVLSQSDKKVVAEAIEIIPAEIRRELEEFVGYYHPKMPIFNGPRPNPRTLRFVREWFANRKQAASA